VHAGKPIDALAAVREARDYLKAVFDISAKLRIGQGERGPLNHAQSNWDRMRPGAEASGDESRSLSHLLWNDERVVELAQACLTNGFVAGMAKGTLPKKRFAGYVAQDKFFLEAFAKAYTLALTKLPREDATGAREFADLVRGVMDELKLHAGYAAKWGVDMSTVVPVAATQAYVDFLNDVANTKDVVACAAAMVPCMRLYSFLGESLVAQRGTAGPYAEWIDTYSDPGFGELATTLEALLDRYASRLEGGYEKRMDEIRQLYVRAMELELAFFSAWDPKQKVEL